MATTRPTVERLPLAAADYFHVAWPADDVIVLGWHPPLGPGGWSNGSTMTLATLTSTEHVVVDGPARPFDCAVVYDKRPQAITGGRFTFIRDCLTDGPEDHHEIRSTTIGTADQQLVAALDDIWLIDGRANLYSVTLDPTLSAGFIGIGGGICDSVARFDATGVHPFTFRHLDGSDVGDAFDVPCSQTMNVREPNLTPDGRELAVLVAPDTLGKDGWDRLDAFYDVQVVDPETGTSRLVAEHLRAPNRMILSPDGTTLVVVGDAGIGSGRYAVLVPMNGGEPTWLDVRFEGPIEEIAWSPDGKSLVALVRTTPLDVLDRLAVPVVMGLPEEGPPTATTARAAAT
jgi:hypothetical protein